MTRIYPKDHVKITERKCSVNLQPKIEVGQVYHVHGVDKTKTGATVLILWIKGKDVRCNSDRFSWKKVDIKLIEKRANEAKKKSIKTMVAAAQQAAFDRRTEQNFANFSFREKWQVSHIPLMLYDIIWSFADKIVAYSSAHRIDVLLGLTRSCRMLHNKYNDYIGSQLDRQHQVEIHNAAKTFIAENRNYFSSLEYYIVSYINNHAFGIPHLQLRAMACQAMLLTKMLRTVEDQLTSLIRYKTGFAHKDHLPHSEALIDVFDAYIGDCNFETNAVIDQQLVTIKKKFFEIEPVEDTTQP